MSDETVEGRVRLRLSVNPALNEMLEETSSALGIPPTTVATFALSLGLRALCPMIMPETIKGFADVIRDNSSIQSREAVADAGLPVR